MLYSYENNRFHSCFIHYEIDEVNQSGNATLIEGKEGQEIIKTIITTVVFDKYRNSCLKLCQF